ncbi:uncharacterized protein LOC143248437 [Tachypleus tridentatus]|uniref:uncharacterized protein LOC143248437 n=1 Tax=Tachypleus tridentatus TaxID=6853 RepID=UPI003FCF8AA3
MTTQLKHNVCFPSYREHVVKLSYTIDVASSIYEEPETLAEVGNVKPKRLNKVIQIIQRNVGIVEAQMEALCATKDFCARSLQQVDRLSSTVNQLFLSARQREESVFSEEGDR